MLKRLMIAAAAAGSLALAAPAFAAAATHAPVDYAFAYGEGDEPRSLMTITKFTVVPESSLVGWTIGRIEDEFDVQVLAHRRERFDQHPSDDVVLSAVKTLIETVKVRYTG